MAELLLKIGDESNYEDGDCLCAFSDHRIACCHAQMICHPRKARRNSGGLIERDELAMQFYNLTSQYRFERISATEIDRVVIGTGQRERFGPESIDVRLFVRRRKKNPNCVMFGEDGREIWFGGHTDFSKPAITLTWRVIEQLTDRQQSDERYQLWSMGRLDIRSHLAVRVNALTDKQAEDFVEPEYETDDNGDFVWELRDGDEITDRKTSSDIETPPDNRQGWNIVVASKRRHNAKWSDMLADLQETASRIRDPHAAIGHEYDEPEGKRYTSKTQPRQRLTRIEKKQPK